MVTKSGPSAVSGPYSLELTNLTPRVTLTNGTTVSGLPAVQVIGAGVPLAPGQTVNVPVSFSNPSMTVINYAPVVVNQ